MVGGVGVFTKTFIGATHPTSLVKPPPEKKALLTVVAYKYFYDNESFKRTENLEGVRTINMHLILQLCHGRFLSGVIEYIHGTQK